MKRTILISGGNRGIGKAIAIKALKDGHRVSLGVRDPQKLSGTVLDPKVAGDDRLLVDSYEATIPKTGKDLVLSTLDKFGRLDTIINCAGIFDKVSFMYEDKEKEAIERLLKVNVMGPWHLTKEAWPAICRSGNGRVIMLVSMSGKRSKGRLAGYTMSKFALMGLSQTIRNEGWKKGVRVTAICPGWVNTDMAIGVKEIQKDDMTQPDDIASITSNLLTLPNSSVPFEIALSCNLEI